MKELIASGPVIIRDGKLLVTKDQKDDFYKIPGGTLEEGESLEGCALREFPQETGFKCKLIRKLSTMELTKRPGKGEKIKISLHHYLAELISPIDNYDGFNYGDHEVRWLDIPGIKRKEYNVAPNIYFLIEKEEALFR